MRFFTIFSCTILTIFGFLLVHGEESSSVDNHMESTTRIADGVSEACTCATEHTQTKFCQADFVFLVLSQQVMEVNDHENTYRVKLRRIFKANSKAQHVLNQKPLLLWSPSFSSKCAPEGLTPGGTWVVSGQMINNKPSITLCSISKLWSKVSSNKRKNFQFFYPQGCSCPISSTSGHRKRAVFESTGGNNCLWKSSEGPQDCEERLGACIMDKDGVCDWKPSVPYNKCIAKYQLKRKISHP